MSTFVLIAIIILILILLILINTLLSMYKKVPINKALIVFGFGERKVIKGGGTVVLPMLQQAFEISLESRLINLKTNEVLTKDGVPVVCDFSFSVKVHGYSDDILKYAERFLNKSDKEINEILEKILLECAQEAISLSTLNQLLYDKEEVISILNKIFVAELGKNGFIVDNSVINNIIDTKGIVEKVLSNINLKINSTYYTLDSKKCNMDSNFILEIIDISKFVKNLNFDLSSFLIQFIDKILVKEFSNIYYEDIINKIKGDLELELIKKINEQLQDLGLKILKVIFKIY